MYGLMDYGAIADEAVDELFGFDGEDDELYGRRAGPRRRAFRAGKRTMRRKVNRRRSAARETERAALGSRAWQQGLIPGQNYATGGGYSAEELLAPEEGALGSDLLDAEIDALLSEDDEYGYDPDYYGFDDEFDEYGADDEDDEFGNGDDPDDEMYVDEFGRLRRFRGRGRKKRGKRKRRKAFRRGMKMARRKMRRRRKRRKSKSSSSDYAPPPQPQFPGFPGMPMLMQPQAYEEEEEEEEDEFLPPMPTSMTPAAIAKFHAENYGASPVHVAPPPHQGPSFTESVVMGAGVGLGFMAAAIGISAVARGFGAK